MTVAAILRATGAHVETTRPETTLSAGLISIGDVVKYRLDELELEANIHGAREHDRAKPRLRRMAGIVGPERGSG